MNQPGAIEHPRLTIDVIPQEGSDAPLVQLHHTNIVGGWLAVLSLLITAQQIAFNAAMDALEKTQQKSPQSPTIYIPGIH